MLGRIGGYPAEGSPADCKRDWERDIKRERESLERARKLKEALFEYIGNRHHIEGPLAEMVGDLVFEERWREKNIQTMIVAQEKEQEVA